MNITYYPDFPLFLKEVSVDNNFLKIIVLKNTNKDISKYSLIINDKEYTFDFDKSKNEQMVTIEIENNYSDPVFGNVWFDDGQSISFNDKLKSVNVVKPRSVYNYGLERYYYKREISKRLNYSSKNINFIAQDYDYYWNCLCGNQNINKNICDCCGIKKEDLFKVKINVEPESKVRITKTKISICYLFLTFFSLTLNLIYTLFIGTPIFHNSLNNSLFGIFNVHGLGIIFIASGVLMLYASQTHNKKLYLGLNILNLLLLIYLNIILIIYPLRVSYAFFLCLMLDFTTFVLFFISLKLAGFKCFRLIETIVASIGFICSIISFNRFINYNISIDDNGIYLKENSIYDDKYVVKEELNGLPITKILFSDTKKYKFKEFEFSKNLKEIIIPYASILNNLEEINLNQNEYFYSSDGVIYNKNTNKVVLISKKTLELEIDNEEILFNSFYGANNIKKVIIGPNVKKIGKNAFEWCSNLEEIDFSNSNIVEIEEKAFNYCMNLKKIELPISLKKLGYGAFSSNYCLEEIKIPFIGEKRENRDDLFLSKDFMCYIFGGPMYTNSNYIPSKLKKIEIYDISRIHNVTFYNLENVEEITISSDLRDLGVRSFYNCKKLKKVNIKGTFTEIYESMFEGCESLTELRLPTSVKKIDKNAFKNCNSLTKIIYNGDKESLEVEDKEILNLIISE